MKALLFIFTIFASGFINIMGQLTTPTPEAVYGGRINAIDGYSISATQTRIFIATESANSIFYGDMTTGGGSPTFGSFATVPEADADNGFGSGISQIGVDPNSDFLFFIYNGDLMKTDAAGTPISNVYSGNAGSFLIYGSPTSYLFILDGGNVYFGTLDASGNFTASSASPLSVGASGFSEILVNPVNNKLYIAELNSTAPTFYKSSDTYNSFSASTSFTGTTPAILNTGTDTWSAFGIGPDGALFYGGYNTAEKRFAYSESDGATWTLLTTGIGGIGSNNMDFAGSASPYTVYFAKCYSTFTAGSGFGTWSVFGDAGFDTHPNDGSVFVDPINSSVVYMTTDQGIGATTDGGATIFEIDDGVEAVQVQDFDMSSSKTTGWAASKSGIRYVKDFNTALPNWSNAMFPNSDGSPYFSADMVLDNGPRAFVGNVRVYETTDFGSSWSKVFTAENAPYNFPSVGSEVQAIEVCPYDSNLIMAGYFIQGTDQGGLFYSTDGGTNWDQVLCRASSAGNDVDVYDIGFTHEGGNIVAYAGVYYDLGVAIADRGRSVYRCEWNGSAWSVRQDMDSAYTAVGYPITATIIDVQTSVTGDTVFICGTDAGANHAIAYYKVLSGTNKWTTLTTSGFPMSTGSVGKAVTVGMDTCYVAVDNSIYTLDLVSGTSWTNAYTYPVGTEINVLFYDDLLVGTGTGLYAQNIDSPLPVELTSFSANVVDGNVFLNWQTATELNNYGFSVERSAAENLPDGWTEIGFVNGSGTSSSTKKYSFQDSNPPTGNIMYRLKQIDNNGTFEYSDIINVEIGAPLKFELSQNYPNPFNPSTIIKYELPAESFVKLAVFDALGRQTAILVNGKQSAGVYRTTFNAQNLASGVYIYKLTAENSSGEISKTRKMMLLK